MKILYEKKKKKNYEKRNPVGCLCNVHLIIVNGFVLFCDFRNAVAKSVILILCHREE